MFILNWADKLHHYILNLLFLPCLFVLIFSCLFIGLPFCFIGYGRRKWANANV